MPSTIVTQGKQREDLLGTVVRKVVFDEELEQSLNWSKGVSLAFTYSQEAPTHRFSEAVHLPKLKVRSQESLGHRDAGPAPSGGPLCLSRPATGSWGSPPACPRAPEVFTLGSITRQRAAGMATVLVGDCPSWRPDAPLAPGVALALSGGHEDR